MAQARSAKSPRHYIYFIPYGGNKKHSLEAYIRALKKLCAIMSSQLPDMGIVGDVTSISAMSQHCRHLQHGRSKKLNELRYSDWVF